MTALEKDILHFVSKFVSTMLTTIAIVVIVW